MKDASKSEKVTNTIMGHGGSLILHGRDARKTVDFLRNMQMFLL